MDKLWSKAQIKQL